MCSADFVCFVCCCRAQRCHYVLLYCISLLDVFFYWLLTDIVTVISVDLGANKLIFLVWKKMLTKFILLFKLWWICSASVDLNFLDQHLQQGFPLLSVYPNDHLSFVGFNSWCKLLVVGDLVFDSVLLVWMKCGAPSLGTHDASFSHIYRKVSRLFAAAVLAELYVNSLTEF